MPPEEVNSQEIEDVLADETEVIEPDERRQRNGKDESTEPEMQNEGGEIVELKRPAPAKGKSSELSARTDQPVRMYLREPWPWRQGLAEKLGMPLEKVRKVLKIAKEPLSLETPIGDEEDLHLGDFIEDKNAILPIDAAI